MKGEVGIGIAGSFTPNEYTTLAVTAEAFGFDAITVFGDLMVQPPIMPLATMAQATQSIRLGVACYNPWTLHPVEIAGQVAYLDLLSEGRAFYGFVRGAWLDSLGIDQRRSIAAIEDAVAICQKLFRGDPSGYDGRVYHLAPNTNLFYEPLRRDVPLMIGTWSPRLASYAGTVADEVQAGGCAAADMVAHLSSMTAGGHSLRAGSGKPGVCLNAVTIVDHDRGVARARARAETVLYFEVIAAMDPFIDLDPELLGRITRLVKSGQLTEAGALIPDEHLDRFAFAGTPDDVAKQAAAILDAGAKRVEFDTPFGLDGKSGLDMLGREVLPRIAAHLGQ